MSAVLQKLQDSVNSIEAEKIINEMFPGWLVHSTLGYSLDYPHLETNWKRICELVRKTPQKIVFVTDINFEDDDKTKSMVCDFMTKNGYCVRRVEEFTICPVCYRAIPCQEIWHLLKEKGFSVPQVWSDKCQKCNLKINIEK